VGGDGTGVTTSPFLRNRTATDALREVLGKSTGGVDGGETHQGTRSGEQSLARWEYHYVDARTGALGFGWLGFAKRVIDEYDGGVFVAYQKRESPRWS
jgi:hypothetical protein